MARPTKKNPKGKQRKPKLTPETLAKLEQAFAIDSTVGEACFYAGIAVSTLYHWNDSNPELMERLNLLRNTPVLAARDTIVKSLKEPEHAKWYLERKRKKEFAQRQELTGEDGEPLAVLMYPAKKDVPE